VYKKKLLERRAALIAKADGIVSDETRDFGEEEKKKVDQILAKIASIDNVLAKMGADCDEASDDEADDEEGEDDKKDDDEEDSARDNPKAPAPAPAPTPFNVRSKGRRSRPGVPAERQRTFNVARAAADFIERGKLTGYEAECDQELRRLDGGCAGAFKMPFGDCRKLNRRDLTLTTGAGAVPVWTDGQEFIDYLYPKMVGPQLGFRYIEGLMGVTKFPRQSSVPTVTAVAEQGSASGSAPGLDYVQFTPHTITANVTISRKFAMQSVVPANRYVMEAGSRQVAVQMDQWAISGDGASNRPTGLLNNSAVTNFQYATSNALAYGDALAMKKQVAKANANFGNLGWLTSPAGFAKLAQTPKIGSTFPVFIINDEEQINGEKVIQSSQVSDNLTYSATAGLTALMYGNWEMLAVALFGNGLDVIVDPYTQSKAGDLIITFLLDMDTELLQPGAFSICPNVGE
jgi:HK97 family phage major capsid protein